MLNAFQATCQAQPAAVASLLEDDADANHNGKANTPFSRVSRTFDRSDYELSLPDYLSLTEAMPMELFDSHGHQGLVGSSKIHEIAQQSYIYSTQILQALHLTSRAA